MRWLILVLVVVLLTGCSQKYICTDGTTVYDPSQCKEEEVVIVEEPAAEDDSVAAEEVKEVKKEYIYGEFEGEFYPVGLEVKNRGITLRFLGYYYIKKGDDFGKITGVKYRIKNEGLKTINPGLKLSMKNNEGNEDLRTVDIKRDYKEIEVGEEFTEEVEIALSFNRLDTEKTLELEVFDLPQRGTYLFTVITKADFSQS